VTVTGKAGTGDGLGVGATEASGVAVATTAAALGEPDDVAAPPQADRIRMRAASTTTSGRAERDENTLEPPGGAVGGVAKNRETPRFEQVERGV
jgi:hypothetical protein